MVIKEDQGCEVCEVDLCLVFCGGVGEHSECVVFGGRRPSVRRSPFAVGSPWVVVGIREKAPEAV